MGEVKEIYDQLFQFESKKRYDAYPIHKKLQLEEHDDLIDWLMGEISFEKTDDVWDAGCGVGYSLIKLGPQINSGYGCSLSDEETAYAKTQATAQGLNEKLRFEVASFDDSSTRQYDKILMIESFKHTNNLEFTLRNVLSCLSPKGKLIIVDDFAQVENSSVKEHRKLWSAPNFCSVDHLIESIKSFGNFKIRFIDLTDKVPIRNTLLLNTSVLILKLISRVSMWQSQNVKTYLGGLLLEQLYSRHQVVYQAIIAERNS